jgi:hypothetical protein
MPLIAVRAATPYDRPGRKARQDLGLRVQENCTQACSQLADRISRVIAL